MKEPSGARLSEPEFTFEIRTAVRLEVSKSLSLDRTPVETEEVKGCPGAIR